jgi:hypothetical protein
MWYSLGVFFELFYFSYVLMRCRSNVINFFQKFLASPWLLMSYCLFEKSLYSFLYDISYTHFVQCVEYKNDEQSCLLIPAIQNLMSQKLPLYPDVNLR